MPVLSAAGALRRVLPLALMLACLQVVSGYAAEPDATTSPNSEVDYIKQLQADAARTGHADWGHWGPDPGKYSSWTSHSNRLIPVYTFGITLESVAGERSIYRDESRLRDLYGRLPERTVNPEADYFDQTDVYRLQQTAASLGKKYIVLVVFDGMDWQTTWAAAIARSGKVGYRQGRGTGLHMQDYRGTTTDFGYFVTSPYGDGMQCDVNSQTIVALGMGDGNQFGGYDWTLAGSAPWDVPVEREYMIGKSKTSPHVYTDSAASATSLTTGIKTWNDEVNVDPFGRQVPSIAHQLQEQGYAIGVVTSVPISHATPACAYAHNVHRNDYQDLTRDLLGLPSVSHPQQPLPGVDVLLGAGWGVTKEKDAAQGANFVPGNRYLAAADLAKIDIAGGGRYVVVQRTPGMAAEPLLTEAANRAAREKQRLFGYFGASLGHLPFRTADGNYDPTIDRQSEQNRGKPEQYTPADIEENPTLAEMTRAALQVLSADDRPFWLMVESGDVDWANHANNIDCSIGAVISGDEAIRVITDWVESQDAWDDTAVIVTADHGHFLMLDRPEALATE